MDRPSPYMLIRETQHVIDENSIQKELERLYMVHINNGDDDIRNVSFYLVFLLLNYQFNI